MPEIGNELQKQISIAVPAFNEADIILKNVREIETFMGENLPNLSYELVVVNDGSTDGMGELLDTYEEQSPHFRVIHHPYNMGRGRAVRTAMNSTNSDFLIVLDADLSYSPEHIPLLLGPLQDSVADLTLASAYHPDGSVKNVPIVRALMSKYGNIILSSSFRTKISTVTCIVRGYTREVIDHLELINDGKDLHLEVLYKSEILGFRIAEVAADLCWRDRKRGQTKKIGMAFSFDSQVVRMRRVIFSHFLFNFFTKPKLLFALPTLLGAIFATYGTGTLLFMYVSNILAGSGRPLRQTLLEGQLTVSLTLASFILSLLFLFFFFISSQLKQYFEEQYILSTRNHYLLKKLVRQLTKTEN